MLPLIQQSTRLLSATLSNRAFSFFANILAARTLDLENFGLLMFIRGTIATVEAIFINPLGDVTIRNLVAEKGRATRAAWNYFLITLLIGLVIAPVVLGFILSTPHSSELFILSGGNAFAAISVLLALSVGVLCSTALLKIIVGYGLVRPLSYLAAISSGVFALIFYLCSSTADLIEILQILTAFYVVDIALKAGLLFLYSKRSRTIQSKGNSRTPSIKNYGVLHLLVSSAITALLFWGARFVLALSPGGLEQLGLFDAALHIFTVIMLLTGAMTTVALRSFAEKPLDTRAQLLGNTKLVIITTVPLCLLFGLFSSEVMSVFGPSFVQGSYLIWLVGVISIFASLASLLDKLHISMKNERAISLSTLLASVITLIFVLTQNNSLLPHELATIYVVFYISKFFLVLYPSYKYWRSAQ